MKTLLKRISARFAGGDISSNTKPSEPPKPEWWPEWIALMAAYPVGRKFEYLGRTMVVTHRRQGYYGISFSFPTIWPAIITEYADSCGQIHEHAFGVSTWPILSAR